MKTPRVGSLSRCRSNQAEQEGDAVQAPFRRSTPPPLQVFLLSSPSEGGELFLRVGSRASSS